MLPSRSIKAIAVCVPAMCSYISGKVHIKLAVHRFCRITHKKREKNKQNTVKL